MVTAKRLNIEYKVHISTFQTENSAIQTCAEGILNCPNEGGSVEILSNSLILSNSQHQFRSGAGLPQEAQKIGVISQRYVETNAKPLLE